MVGFRAGCVAGFAVGGAGVWKTVFSSGAKQQHFVYRGKVLTVQNSAFGALHNLLRRKGNEGFQPQALGVVQRFGVGESRAELVVVVQLEQCENLVDRALFFIQQSLLRGITSLCL